MKIGAVIVTYNRLEKLKTALESFARQTCPPEYLIVVDNASTDGTGPFLDEWQAAASGQTRRIVVHMDRNTGGSGGFYAGLKRAMEEEAGWIWVSDDDAYPAEDALAIASAFLDRHVTAGEPVTEAAGAVGNGAAAGSAAGAAEPIAAICAKVMSHGSPDPYHGRLIVRRGLGIREIFVPEEYYRRPAFEKNSFSYVGTIMSKACLKKAGLPNKDYFIYFDDTEHGMRMRQLGRIWCIPAMTVNHDVPPESAGLTWKYYYAMRNMTDMYRRHFPGLPFAWFALKVRLKTWFNALTGRRDQRLTILETAFCDALAGRFGLHEIYRPGWKPHS